MGREKEITIEIEHVRIVCQRTRRYDAWCAGCEKNGEFITPLEAAALSGQTLDRISELISIGVIHDLITPAQTFLVCLDSLLRMGESLPEIKIIQPINKK